MSRDTVHRCLGTSFTFWAVVGAAIGAVLVVRLAATEPVALGLILAVFSLAIGARPRLLATVRTERSG